VILKVQNPNNLGATINAVLTLQVQNQIINAPVPMHSFREIFPPKHRVFAAIFVKMLNVDIR
jgi:hypothetical protein